MQIQINTDRNIEGREALATQVTGVVESALNLFSDHITRVEVHLSDENSDKKVSTDDMRCVMEARLEGRQPIAVTHQAATLDQAVDGAAEKLTRMIESTLGGCTIKRIAGLTRQPDRKSRRRDRATPRRVCVERSVEQGIFRPSSARGRPWLPRARTVREIGARVGLLLSNCVAEVEHSCRSNGLTCRIAEWKRQAVRVQWERS